MEYRALRDYVEELRAKLEAAEALMKLLKQPDDVPLRLGRPKASAPEKPRGARQVVVYPANSKKAKVFAKAIRSWRVDKKLSQREVAEKMGLRHTDVSSYESGKRGITEKTIARYQKVCPEALKGVVKP